MLITCPDGDLNVLVTQGSGDRVKIRKLLKDIKGLGDVGVDIFFDTAQGVLPILAPFVDPRSKATAEAIGISGDIDQLYDSVGRNPVSMCRLASALTNVRLERAEAEFRE